MFWFRMVNWFVFFSGSGFDMFVLSVMEFI